MHAAAQVQAQVHGVGAQGRQPVRRGRHQVQGDGVVGILRVRVQDFFDLVLGLELRVGGVEAQPYRADRAVHLERTRSRADAGLVQRLFGPGQGVLSDLDGRLGPRDLDRRRLTVEIGQRVEHADQDGGQNEEVFPDWVAVHGRSGEASLNGTGRRTSAPAGRIRAT